MFVTVQVAAAHAGDLCMLHSQIMVLPSIQCNMPILNDTGLMMAEWLQLCALTGSCAQTPAMT